jgi:hypothetical protein
VPLYTGIVVRRLRAICAVLRTTTGFYRKKGGALHLKWVKVFSVDSLGLVDKVRKGLRVKF